MHTARRRAANQSINWRLGLSQFLIKKKKGKEKKGYQQEQTTSYWASNKNDELMYLVFPFADKTWRKCQHTHLMCTHITPHWNVQLKGHWNLLATRSVLAHVITTRLSLILSQVTSPPNWQRWETWLHWLTSESKISINSVDRRHTMLLILSFPLQNDAMLHFKRF